MRSPWQKPSDPVVRLDVYQNMTLDLRGPLAMPSQEIREALDAHKERRAKECQKVEPAIEYPDWRLKELAHKYGDDEPREPRSSFYHPYR